MGKGLLPPLIPGTVPGGGPATPIPVCPPLPPPRRSQSGTFPRFPPHPGWAAAGSLRLWVFFGVFFGFWLFFLHKMNRYVCIPTEKACNLSAAVLSPRPAADGPYRGA